MTFLKAIAVRDTQGNIKDLYALAIVAKREAERILHHTHFRVLPDGVSFVKSQLTYTVLIEVEDAPVKAPHSFGETMSRAKAEAAAEVTA